jgi:hypothetical protein
VTNGKHSRDTDGDLRGDAGNPAVSSGEGLGGDSLGVSTLWATSVELDPNEFTTASCWIGICGVMDNESRSEIPTF